MSDEQQKPEEPMNERLAARLKEWGIDLETFQKKIQDEGEEARDEFNKLVSDVQSNMRSNQERMGEQTEKIVSDMTEMGERMTRAWGSMMGGFIKAWNDLADAPDDKPKNDDTQ